MHNDTCDCYPCVKERETRTLHEFISSAKVSLSIPSRGAVKPNRTVKPKTPEYTVRSDGVKVYPYKPPRARQKMHSKSRCTMIG
jgi:hypothetical protein